MKDNTYLSPQKFKELKEELEVLRTVRRREIAASLDQARSFGDLSENAEYQKARDDQEELEERISFLDDMLRRAVLVEGHHSSNVELGSTVKVKRGSDSAALSYMIVGSAEADLMNGKISNESPLGAAMLGRKKGDSFEITMPKGKVSYTILAIE